MSYSENTKVKYEQLDSELQEKLNSVLESESSNQSLAQANKTKLNTLFTDLTSKISRLEELSSTLENRILIESNYISSADAHPYGYGEALEYSEKYGLVGQVCKNDDHTHNRVIPWEAITLVRLCNIENQATILNRPITNNEKYAYNYENHRVYFRTSRGNWVLYDPIDEGKYIFLYNSFVFDTVSKKLWYFINPYKAIYIWTSDRFVNTLANNVKTPRVQTPLEYEPTDSTNDPEEDIIQYEAKFKNTMHITANNAKRPDQKYEYNVLVGEGYYFKDYKISRNKDYEFKFKSYCDGPASIHLGLVWNIYQKPYPEEITLTKILNEKSDWGFKSKGPFEIWLDGAYKMSGRFTKDFHKWEFSCSINSNNLTKGEHYVQIKLTSDLNNHLFINHLDLLVTHR